MDVKKISLFMGMIGFFSIFFTFIFVRPEFRLKKKIFSESKNKYRTYLISLTNVFLAAILFSHIKAYGPKYDPLILIFIVVFLIYSNAPTFRRNNDRAI